MVHFQTKTHLISWLEKHCTRRAIVRALSEGTFELLGGFSMIPPTTRPGWIVKVTSEYGKKWNVAVIAYQNRYGVRILSKVPWRYWCNARPWTTLLAGDNPERYQHNMIFDFGEKENE